MRPLRSISLTATALATALLLAVPLRAQEPLPEATPRSFSAIATPDKVRMGEPFLVTVEVRDAKDVRYELPADLQLGSSFDLRKVEATRTVEGEEQLTRFTLQLALFALDEQAVPDLKLSAVGPDGARQLTVPGPKVVGLAELDEQASLKESMPPVEVPVPDYTLLWVLGATLLGAALGLLAWSKLRGWRPRVRAAPVAPVLPAHTRALQALEALQREDLPGRGRAKEFHFRLSEIVRGYLGERFAVNALDMTSDELLAALGRVPTPGLDFGGFEQFCREGDLVKFAKAEASLASCKTALDQAFRFVQDTSPRPSPEGEGKPTGAVA